MMILIIGMTGFLFLLLSDVGQVHRRYRLSSVCSSIGYLGITGAIFFSLLAFPPRWTPLWLGILAASFASLFAGLLVFSLFIDIPGIPSRTYPGTRQTSQKRTYGLVRHPGFIWYLFLNLSLGFLVRDRMFIIYAAILVSVDLSLVIAEDFLLFPKIFNDYDVYKKKVPFIIPWLKSHKKDIRFEH